MDPWFARALAAAGGAARRDGAPALAELRAAGAAALRGVGFPTRRREAWRRFDVAALRESVLVAPRGAGAADLLAAAHEAADSEGRRLVLVDGAISAALSDLAVLQGNGA